MIDGLPNWINWAFIATFFVTIALFHLANGRSKKLSLFIVVWSLFHAVLAYNGFYNKTDLFPPRFLLVLIPSLSFLIFGLLKKNREQILAKRNIRASTFLHVIRIPVEIMLFYLYLYKTMPQLMTFEGRNFDIIAGILALVSGILFYVKSVGKTFLLVFNGIGLLLILFVFVNGILSSELPIQMFAFDQPTKALEYFPFVLLPATIVPIVIYTHIIDLILLMRKV
ncbi:hypothetical protein [Costertonia aggregata]|uniref:Uncharacterized protein n=1 Tax=Costertonia aggregata TaxID=343403 RepID=A0A7H9AP05_9FLAO|nr:hypothetical protein [Costertonia aggregata]QLG45113.1 hypothetical protein HYG79_07035 [Costertonia aggregata]